MISKETWVIMSTCRTVIAAGNPRDRKLIKGGDAGSQRILTYTTKGKAESAFKKNGFWPKYKENYNDPDLDLEAVKVNITYEEVVDE